MLLWTSVVEATVLAAAFVALLVQVVAAVLAARMIERVAGMQEAVPVSA
ncbi:hypothetical protein [Lentzea sp.]